MPLRPNYTFERFTATPGNRRAVRACRALVRAWSPGALFLVGPPATGKTHLLQSVAHALESGPALATVAYTPAGSLAHEYVEAIRRADSLSAVSNKYARHTVVLIDDVQELAGKPATQDSIARLISACLDSGARVLCAATRWPIDGTIAGPAWPTVRVVRLTPPSPESMTRIVRRASVTEPIRPSRRTMRCFAKHARGDVRRALGALALWRLRHQLLAG